MDKGLFLIVFGLCFGSILCMSIDDRVYKGKKDASNNFPSSCWLELNSDIVCGAVLVSDDLLVTLAECVADANASLYKVVIGDLRYKKSSNEEFITPKRFIVHPDYNSTTGQYNIAWIRLSQKAGIDKDNIGIADTYPNNITTYKADEGTSCVLSSYGARFENGAYQYKQALNIVLKDDISCIGIDKYILGDHFCHQARKVKKGYKACQGDKGSPIMCPYNGGWVYVGLQIEDGCTETNMNALDAFPYLERTIFWISNLQCDELATVENGELVPSDNLYIGNVTAELNCDEGYVASNENNTITCLGDGEWSTLEAVCLLSCGTPTFDGNGTFVTGSDLNLVNETASLNCSDNYIASTANININCGMDGNWTSIETECLWTCGEPRYGGNGMFNTSSEMYLINDTASLMCDEGYILDLPLESGIVCTDSGWTSVNASCVISCGDLPAVDNGTLTLDSADSRLGSTANLTCDANFVMINENVTVECQADGNWTTLENECALSCGSPPLTANGTFIPDTELSLVNSTATLNCSEGYVDLNSTVITCLDNGNWSEVVTECLTTCGVPIDPTNGTFSARSPSLVGDVSYVNCDVGFLSNLNPIECFEEGWSYNDVDCMLSCGKPDPVDNGYFIDLNDTLDDANFDGFVIGDSAYLACNESYNVSSLLVSTVCQNDGNWTLLATECLKICDELVIPNGFIVEEQGQYLAGDEVTIDCDEGFISPRINTTSCAENGTWEDRDWCQKTCGEPVAVDNGSFQQNSSGLYLVNETAFLTCESGYSSSSEIMEITCQESGNWTIIETECLKICDELSIPNGSIVDAQEQYLAGDTVTFNCREGFIEPVINTTSCNENGTWSFSPRCETTCGEPIAVDNGVFRHNHTGLYLVNETAFLVCDANYSLSSEEIEITCEEGGNWTTIETECLKICDELEIPDGFILDEQEQYLAGDEVTFDCEEGFTAQRLNTSCYENGSWSNFTPCQKGCGEPVAVDNGSFQQNSSGSYLVNETTFLTCDSGYNASSEEIEITCQESGNWTTIETECLKICDPLPDISNGSYQLNTTALRTIGVAQLVCDPLFIASLDNITCSENGTWSEVGECLLVCGPPPPRKNGRFMIDGIYGNLFCDNMYEVVNFDQFVGSETIECEANGRWTWRNIYCILSTNMSEAEGEWLGNDTLVPLHPAQVLSSSRYNSNFLAFNAVPGGPQTFSPAYSNVGSRVWIMVLFLASLF